MKNFIFSLAFVFLSYLVISVAFAQTANQQSAQDDKKVDPPAPVAFWATTPPKVVGKIDQRYDINRDGILSTSEVKIFLRDVVAEVMENNSYDAMASDFLRSYDKNRDGIISRLELEEIKKDLAL
ncbi:MAG: hypothetical protein H6754_05675 [Candidatus Omnitrophica bacterium]|nr:hypothetical protein [Candidatus Omnitrophota bacterium]